MPPKKSSNEPSKKTEKKLQAKVIEDKTFGLKNKNKSKTVQKFIKGVEQQVKNKGISENKLKEYEFQKKAAEEAEEQKQALLTSLYKSVEVIQQREAAAGEDPKSIICAYFKQGLCQKGKKCKFSHDLDVENKAAKIDIYTDQRAIVFANNDEDMSTWGDKKLQDVVNANQNKYSNQKPTEIICKYFLDAVESQSYGWRWVCPNGGWQCHYKHCLPQGYILKRDKAKNAEDIDLTPLEELLETERAKLSVTGGTPVTLERFTKWKEDRKKRKEEEAEKKRKEEEKRSKARGNAYGMSGRALFKYDPTLFQDDEEAVKGEEYENREDQEFEEENQKDYEEKKEEDSENGQDEDHEAEEEEGGEIAEEEENQEEDGQENQKEDEGREHEPEHEEEKQPEPKEAPVAQNGNGKEDEKKKKKKKKNKAANQGEVKINEDLFLADDDIDV